MSFLHDIKDSVSPSVRRQRRMLRNDTDESCADPQSSLDKQSSMDSNPSFDHQESTSSRRFTKESLISSTSLIVKNQKRFDSWKIVKGDSIEEECDPSSPFDTSSRRGTKETIVSTRSSVSLSIKQRLIEEESWTERRKGSLESNSSPIAGRSQGTKETIVRRSHRASHSWSMKRQTRFDMDPSEEDGTSSVEKTTTVETQEDVVDTEELTSHQSEEFSSSERKNTLTDETIVDSD